MTNLYKRKNDKTISLDPLCGVLAFVSHPCRGEDFFIGVKMKLISLTQGYSAMVDDSDYEWLNRFNWQYSKVDTLEYASRRAVKGKKYTLGMHREIMKTPKGMHTDHKDGNGLNNQRNNLRICTASQNIMNSKISSNNSSGYKGVYWQKNLKKWMVAIKINRQSIYLGYFTDKKEAAKKYDQKAIELFREFARLNFPEKSK